jgi:hypothetical protein
MPGGVKYYLGVSGGPFCTPTRGCGYTAGTPIILWTATTNGDQNWLSSYPGSGTVQNEFGDPGVGDPWDLAVYGDGTGNNSSVAIEPPPVTSMTWTITSATDLGAPYPGCYAFINQHATNGQNGTKAMVVYQGKVQQGQRVVLYDLCTPTNGKCGNPSNAWHPDQFWCPETF